MKKVFNIFKITIKAIFTKKKKIDYSKWIFSSSFNTKFNYNSKYLFEYVLKYEKSITPLFVINNSKLKKELQDTYGVNYFVDTRTKCGINEVLKSGVWLTSAGLPLYGFFLGRKRKIINLWHGVPLKKIALLEGNLNSMKKTYFKYMFSYNYTSILTTSPNLIPIMSKSFGVDYKKINVLGQPRNDALFDEKRQKNLFNELFTNLPNHKKKILYAPTYREYAKTELFPFPDFNMKLFNDFLAENQIILFINMHQSEIANVGNLQSNRIFFINDNKINDIMEVLNTFDLLITDYSSIYIDYLLLEKPILFLPYDFDIYKRKRGFNFNYDEVTPGPKPKVFEEFIISIKKLLEDNQFYELQRDNVNNFFNEIKEESSKKIVEHIRLQKK